jgi:hypothetical protein
MKKKATILFGSLISLGLIFSCNYNSELKATLVNKNGLTISNKNTIRGKVDFPEAQLGGFKTKATLTDIAPQATVSIIYPHDHVTMANKTVAVGLTDNAGNFIINLDANFIPALNSIYILEAAKRIGTTGNDVITIRTFIKWNGTTWDSITNTGISINTYTTALATISYLKNFAPALTINQINNASGNSIPIDNSPTFSSVEVNQVAGIVGRLLTNNVDSIRFIAYQNNSYFVTKEPNHGLNQLNLANNCPNCDLKFADLTNKDLTNSNLAYANLTGANLTGANLTGANLTGTIFNEAKWTDGHLCHSTLSKGYCAPILGEKQLSTITFESEPFITVSPDNQSFMLTDTYNNGLNKEIRAYRYNDLLTMINFTTLDTASSSIIGSPKTIFLGGAEYSFFAWQGLQTSAPTSVRGKLTDSSFGAVLPNFNISTVTNSKSKVSLALTNANSLFVVYDSNQDGSGKGIYGQIIDLQGNVLISEFNVNTYTTNDQQNPMMVADANGDFIITWESSGQDGSGMGIYGQKINAFGGKIGEEFQISTQTTLDQIDSDIAADQAGNFLVTWESNTQDGSNYGVFGQMIDAQGAKLGTEFRINTYTTNAQQNAVIASDQNNSFIVTWESNGQDADGFGIYAQRLSNTGTKIGSEFKVNTTIIGNQQTPSITSDTNGNFTIVWKSNNGIYGKKYSPNGIEF